MADMDINTIIQDLTKRFASPLPEFHPRRIIFWYDEDHEFEDKLEGLHLTNAKFLRLTGSNTFAVKKRLCHDDTASNYLVYSPLSFQKDDDNWLINVQLYSEEFRADLISIWTAEMNLPATPMVRKQTKFYRKFFNAKDRRGKVLAFNHDYQNLSTPAQIHLAVMAAICGNRDIQPNNIIRAVLRSGLDIDVNPIYQSFVNYNAHHAFWAMISQATGYGEGDDSNLGRLAIHMLLTAAARTMDLDNLAGLEHFISIPHQAYCYDLISDWLHSEDNRQLYNVARYVEGEARLYDRFGRLAVDALINTECFPCINECVLITLMTEISDQIIHVDNIKAAVDKRRTMVWYDDVSSYYEGILQIANMQMFFLEHGDGFHTVEPARLWKQYTTEYYKMDTYYRQFHLCFQRCLKVSNPLLDDLLKHVTEKVEGLYTRWFIGQLGQNWSDASGENLAQFGRILEVPWQADFYENKVRRADTRIFVIISDGFRYEAAASLAEQLRRETQSKVELNSCQAIFPTITKFGMAALLPHKALTVVEKTNGGLDILADGQPTDAGNRDRVLKSANPASVALKYDDIINMKRAERSALVKGMEVVYIYHDKVDKASHISDSAVFPACHEAIDEIKNLVRIIVNEFGGVNVVITADHGFLYTYSPLAELDKVDKAGFASRMVEYGRRFAIMEKGSGPDYLMPVKFMDGGTEYDSFSPRENVRIKMSGGGLNFVHGGTSLQEMVVPVIQYRYLRSDSKAYQRNRDKIDTKPVELSLLSANRKISNMIFSLNFYQKQAVGNNRQAANYLLYFTDANGSQISDICKIIADKTSENGQERTFRRSFNLRSQKYSSRESYFLVIADESGLQMPVKEEFQIDIAFAVDEFNFFE